ncbi:MAG: Ig-like domain-containing protein, partial [Rubrivivax sp.]
MTTPQHRPSLAALAAAVFALSLAACGGGGGEAPPDRPGSVVAPAAPVVTITNNVTAETATGPVTFTFSFNRDVGTSFTADDVTVTGGTKGALTRLSGTGATLVVTPTPNATGTVQLSVAAGSVTDATGAGNAAVTAAKAFNTVPPPPPATGNVVLANFDDIRPPVAGFEGAEGSAIEAGPAGGGSGNSFKVLRSGGQVYALGIVETAVPVTATRRTISAQVYSPLAGIPMVMKIEGPGGASSGDVAANEAVVVGWQTLTWTFSGVNPALTFNKIVLLPRLGTVDAPPGRAYYFDAITLLPAPTGGGSAAALTFSSGFAGGSRKVEGGGFGGFSGSNFDGFNCDGNPANCG